MNLAAWPFVLLGLVFLIVSSAFFSGSETALMAVDRWRIRHLSRKRRRARLVEKILREPEKFIGTILLGNNLVNVAASALATWMAISLMGEGGVRERLRSGGARSPHPPGTRPPAPSHSPAREDSPATRLA